MYLVTSSDIVAKLSELRSDGQARRPVLLDDFPFHLGGRGEGQLEEWRGNQRGGPRQGNDFGVDAVPDLAQVEPDLCHHHTDLAARHHAYAHADGIRTPHTQGTGAASHELG